MATELFDAAPSERRLGRPLTAWRPTPGTWVVVAAAVLLVVAVWWVATDRSVPSWDPAAHMYRSMQYADAFRDGDLTEWFTSYQTPGYPPLVYLLGAFVSLVLGEGTARFVLTSDLVFVPLLALGTYQAGKLAYGARTGAFAAIFVLGSPLIIAQSHVFMLDLPQTAMTAMTIWLLLASRRFERPGIALAAGLAFGLGMLTKNIFPLMLLGLIGVALLRGGWRHWKGIALFALGVAVTGLPWYLAHFTELYEYARGGTVSGSASMFDSDPPRWSLDDWSWYLWAAFNPQYYLPLWLFGAAGTMWGLTRLVRHRPWASDDVTPEIFGALAVAVPLCVALTKNDPRYTMPLIIYLAILGSAWFATSGRRWLRIGAGALLVAICVVNLIGVSAGKGPSLTLHVAHGGNPEVASQGIVAIFSTDGWLVGRPERHPDVPGELRAAYDQGARKLAIDRFGLNTSDYNVAGIGVLARFAGLKVVDYGALGPRDIFVTGGESKARSCGRTADGSEVYFERGRDIQPVASADNLICPAQSPNTYASPTPARPSAQAQALLLAELRAARAQGTKTVYFEDPVPASPLFGGAGGLRALAARAGLTEPPGGVSANTGVDGITVTVLPNAGAQAGILCQRLPDDSALVLEKGQAQTFTLTYATNLYCPTKSADAFAGPGGD